LQSILGAMCANTEHCSRRSHGVATEENGKSAVDGVWPCDSPSILPRIQEIDVRRCVVPYADNGGGDRHWNDSNLTKEQVALFAPPCARLPTLQRFSYTP
jgi:hypothetical protein